MDIIEFRAHHNHLRKASYLHFTEEDTNVQGDELTSAPLSGIKAFLLPQSPLSMEFSRQEHWSGLPCPSPLLSFSLLYLFPLRFWHCPWTVTINFMPLMTNIYWVASAVLSKLPALSHPPGWHYSIPRGNFLAWESLEKEREWAASLPSHSVHYTKNLLWVDLKYKWDLPDG